jgi:hypothetical protein
MPNISHASRSCQAAPANVRVQVPMRGSSSGRSDFRKTRRFVPGRATEASLAAGQAGHGGRPVGHRRREGHVDLGVLVAPVGRGQPVDGREEVEEAAVGRALGHLGDRGPRVGGDPDPESLAHADVAVDHGLAQVLGEGGQQLLAGLVAGRLGDGLLGGRAVGLGGGGVVSQP